MRLRHALAPFVLALLLGVMAPAPPVASAAVAPLGLPRVAEPAAPKAIRKLLDYLGCIGSIIIARDPGSGLGAATTCGNALRTWWEE